MVATRTHKIRYMRGLRVCHDRVDLPAPFCGAIRDQHHDHAYPGGATKPPNARSISPANAIGVRSSRYGPTICMPIGKPSGERPMGIAVAGRPVSVAMPDQTTRLS